MAYQKSYIELQLDFANILAEKLSTPLIDCLYDYTNIFLLLTLDFSFSKDNPTWKNFVDGFEPSTEYIYKKYLDSQNNPENKDTKKSKAYGCFSYHIENDSETLRIHFSNKDETGLGPLAKENTEKRKAELKEMFNDIKVEHPEIKIVKGKSWLYSLDTYKRIFPNEYIESLKEFEGAEWQFMTRWGQFLDSDGGIKENLANEFLECIKMKENIDDMLACFPLKVYEALCEIQYFHK